MNIKLNSKKNPRDIETKFLKSRADYDSVIEYLLLFMDYRKTVVDFIIYILFKVGLRPAEAICLTWDNIDFKNQELFTKGRWDSVHHRLSPPKNDHYYKKINQPNPSVRYIPFDKEVKRVLLKLKKQQEMTCQVLGLKNENNYLFYQVGTKWDLPDESTVNKRVKKIIRELGITPIITAYGARHTYGSVKVQEGVPLEVLAKWFGHKDTSMLRSIYIYIYWTRQKMSGLKEKNYLVGKPVGKLIFDKLKSPINKAFFRFCTMPPTSNYMYLKLMYKKKKTSNIKEFITFCL